MGRPMFSILSREQISRVVEQAVEILEKVGVYIENQEAIALLKQHDVRLEGGRAYIHRDLIFRSLESAPSKVILYDREERPCVEMYGDNVCFDPGSAAIHVLDRNTKRRRKPIVKDCIELAWVTEACNNISAQSTGIIPSDVPEEIADRYRLYIALCNSRKPIVTGTFRKDGFVVMREMLDIVRSGSDNLRRHPLAIFDCCPTPPLKWSDLTCQSLIDCAKAGIPAELVSMPLGGASSPVTIREMVVQHCAECLSGVVIHQLAHQGSPIIWGGSPSAFDMRYGTTPMGAVETQMTDVAFAQVGKYLGLPTHAYMGLSDSKVVDWQAGQETGFGVLLAALAGINMVSGPGMLDFESCQSLEKLILDNEACGMALRLVQGISEDSAHQSVELIAEVVAKGHFLGHPHTREHFRKELYIPGKVIDRMTYGDWEKRGGMDSFESARIEVERIISKGNPAPLDRDIAYKIYRVIEEDAARLGVDIPKFGDVA